MTDRLDDKTPVLWLENAIPTPEQLAAWLGLCTRAERIDHARRALEAAEACHRCFMEGHDILLAEVTRLRAAVDRVRALHRPEIALTTCADECDECSAGDGHPRQICSECIDTDDELWTHVYWPCPTVHALACGAFHLGYSCTEPQGHAGPHRSPRGTDEITWALDGEAVDQ